MINKIKINDLVVIPFTLPYQTSRGDKASLLDKIKHFLNDYTEIENNNYRYKIINFNEFRERSEQISMNFKRIEISRN